MSKISPQRFSVEEFPEQQDWIGKLFTPLNQLTGEIVAAFANGLSVKDNLMQEIKEVKWVNSTTNFPLKFRTKFGNKAPIALLPGYLLNNTTGAYSTVQPWVVWSYKDGEVLISDVMGLVSGNTYTIRLVVIYE